MAKNGHHVLQSERSFCKKELSKMSVVFIHVNYSLLSSLLPFLAQYYITTLVKQWNAVKIMAGCELHMHPYVHA